MYATNCAVGDASAGTAIAGAMPANWRTPSTKPSATCSEVAASESGIAPF